jgi:hypothetical protein
MKRIMMCMCVVVGFAAADAAQAQSVPALLPIQGTMTNAEGQPVDGEVEVIWTIATEDNGQRLNRHRETQQVDVKNGHFAVYLGTEESLNLTIFQDGEPLSVGMTIDGDTTYFQLGTVPYAAMADHADSASTAGRADLANTARDAEKLGGVAADNYATNAHDHDSQYASASHSHPAFELECVDEKETRAIASNDSFAITVACPSGYSATGGGVSPRVMPSTAPTELYLNSFPGGGETWICYGRHDLGRTADINCRVKCCGVVQP